MPVRLLVTANAASADGQKPPPQELKLDGDAISIGRDKTATVVLAEPSVSRSHARITREGSLYFIEDAGSAFGTRVNGQVLPKGEKRLLRNGDVIAVGTFDLAFTRLLEVADSEGDGEVHKTTAMARAVMKDVMRGLSGGNSPYLVVLNGPHKDAKHEVSEAKEIVFGRADDCDIVFADDLTSRRHAKIRRDWSGTHVEDLGSRNGVKVNRKPIKGPATLKDRDEIEIGGTRLLYVDPSEVRETPFVPPQTDPGLDLKEEPPARVPKRPATGAVAAKAQPEPEPEPEPPPEPVAEVPEPEPEPLPFPEELLPEPPRSAMGRLRERVPQIPTDAAALRRYLPLLVVGGIVVAGLSLLIFILAGG